MAVWLDDRKITGTGMRRCISYVPQDHILHTGTVEDNIRYGNSGASFEAVTEAALKANIHDTILELPEGYKTMIEENGKKEQKFYFYDDRESNDLITETLKHKMWEAGLPDDDTLKVEFDLSYMNKKKKLVTIHGIKNKASMCPVIIHGRPESKLFAWTVGLGNGTGISLGAVI